MVELIAKPGAHIPYTTIRNWSNNVYNLVTKHAVAYEGATVQWVDGNLGSKLTIKYPAVYLLGRRARADILSVAFAGAGQTQNAGGKMIHVAKGAVHAKSFVRATRCCWTNKAAATATHPLEQVFYTCRVTG